MRLLKKIDQINVLPFERLTRGSSYLNIIKVQILLKEKS